MSSIPPFIQINQSGGSIRGDRPNTGYRYSDPSLPNRRKAKDHNKESVGEYISYNVFWMLVAMVWYRNLMFRCMEQQTLHTSTFVLWSLVAVSTFLGTLLGMKHHRNFSSIFFNVLLGFGIYDILAYKQIRTVLIYNVLLALLLIISVFFLLLFLVKKKNSHKNRPPLRLNFAATMIVTHRIIGVGLAIILLATGTSRIFGSSLLKSSVSPMIEKGTNEQTITNSIDILAVLYNGTWERLTAQEKLDVLQTVANIEQRYLGLPHELNCGIEDKDGALAGTYNDETHEIMISTSSLLYDTSWELVNTVCHEAYHAYQHRLIDLWNHADQESRGLKIFRRVRSYAEEFQNYVSSDDDFFTYYIQRCESDAREYADDAEWDYYKKIRDYLEPEEEQDNLFIMPSLDELFGTSTEEQDQN